MKKEEYYTAAKLLRKIEALESTIVDIEKAIININRHGKAMVGKGSVYIEISESDAESLLTKELYRSKNLVKKHKLEFSRI